MTQDTPTVEEIACKRGYFLIEDVVNEYFSTAPHYRGRRALKILLQEKVDTTLTKVADEARREALEEVVSYIGQNEGWEESEDVYREHFGLPTKYK